jgi:uracil-DNA glycosylase
MSIEIEAEIDQDSSIYEALYDQDFGSWSSKLHPHRKSVKLLSDMIQEKENQYGEFYPLKKDVFNFLKMTPLEKVKVVIWGQDPYPTLLDDGTPRAQGYSFGVKKTDTVPQSLKNIYKEIKSNFPMFEPPPHGDLSWLAEQGVLFMNQSLTYCPNNPKLYLNLWNRFTYIMINIINENVENCIHLLWGKQCEPLIEHIRSREIHQSSHPSPLSARRGFFGCKHFLKVNIILENRKNTKIEELEKLLKDKKLSSDKVDEINKEIKNLQESQVQINWNENSKLTSTYLCNL